ncbi:unnamed protein product [Caenorhabditis bovis]|uniref:Domain of unknown function DB domain-containing protein n=1 Tax=Caenorhabditis bovis TaxID=2654633 RepID=A0A8S1EZX7_9PELO|nr:unnamed protein product [Caenorhabditis bovis]
MYRFIACLLLPLLIGAQLMPYNDYRCGSGEFSHALSYTSTWLCDQIAMNQCCMMHDACYAGCAFTQIECDDQFCMCLSSIVTNPLCQAIILPAHCNMVRLFGALFVCPMMG